MRKICSLGLSFFLLCACSFSAEEQKNPAPETPTQTAAPLKKIIAFGDSLTEGYGLDPEQAYPALLQQKLQQEGYQNYEVLNSGVSGETTSGALSRAQWIVSLKPKIVILETGANDALRGVDLNVTQQNIAKILEIFQKAHIAVIFAGMKITENLGQEYTQKFDALYPALAQKFQVPFIPFFLAGVATDSKLNTADEIHPNTEGYKIIVEKNIFPKLEPLLQRE